MEIFNFFTLMPFWAGVALGWVASPFLNKFLNKIVSLFK